MANQYCPTCETRVKVILGRCHLCGSQLRRMVQGFQLKRFALSVGQVLSILGCLSAMVAFTFCGFGIASGKFDQIWLTLLASVVGFFHSLAMWFVFSHVKDAGR